MSVLATFTLHRYFAWWTATESFQISRSTYAGPNSLLGFLRVQDSGGDTGGLVSMISSLPRTPGHDDCQDFDEVAYQLTWRKGVWREVKLSSIVSVEMDDVSENSANGQSKENLT